MAPITAFLIVWYVLGVLIVGVACLTDPERWLEGKKRRPGQKSSPIQWLKMQHAGDIIIFLFMAWGGPIWLFFWDAFRRDFLERLPYAKWYLNYLLHR